MVLQRDSSLVASAGLLLCLCLVLMAGVAHAQAPPDVAAPTAPGARCVNISEISDEDFPPVCRTFLTYDMVYVDDNQAERLFIGRGGMNVAWFTPHCVLAAYRNWCVQIFRPCYEIQVPVESIDGPTPPEVVNGTITVAVGGYACRDICDLISDVCLDFVAKVLDAFGFPPEAIDEALSCNPPWSLLYGFPGVDIFPHGPMYTVPLPSTIDLGNNVTATINASVTLPCYDGNMNITVDIPDAVCPSGTHKEAGFCTFNCPEPLIKDEEYDAVTVMMSIMGWLSFVCTAFLALSYLLDPTKRKFPTVLPLFFIGSVMCLSFSFCMASMLGHENVWCEDSQTFHEFGDPACTIQGILYVYFTLASALWWLVLAFNLFLLVVCAMDMHKLAWSNYIAGCFPFMFRTSARTNKFPRLKDVLRLESLMVAYHLVCWIPPLIVVIIALSAQRLGFGGSDLWCTIHSGDRVAFHSSVYGIEHEDNDKVNTWNLVMLTVPVLAIVGIGTVLIILVVAVGLKKSGWPFFLSQWRLFCFLFMYIWIYVFNMSFTIHLSIEKEDQYEEYTEYLNCLFRKQAFLEQYGLNIECELERFINFPLWFIVAFNIAGQGMLVFVIFGTNTSLWKWWYKIIRHPRFILTFTKSSDSGSMSMIANARRRATSSIKKIAGKKVSISLDLNDVEQYESDPEAMSTSMSSDSSSSDSSDDELEDDDRSHAKAHKHAKNAKDKPADEMTSSFRKKASLEEGQQKAAAEGESEEARGKKKKKRTPRKDEEAKEREPDRGDGGTL